MKFILNLLLSAVIFTVIIPLIPGAEFHGNFGSGILFGFLMGIAGIVLILIAGAFSLATLGIGFIFLAILQGLIFWIIPAIELKMLAWIWPHHLHFSNWGSAIIAGLPFLILNFIMNAGNKKKSK